MLTSIQTLKVSGRQPPVPVAITSFAGDLIVGRWVRILPNRRLVGSGTLGSQNVLVKLFISSRARKHWQREMDGLISLQQAKIVSPDIVASGALDNGGYFICTAFIAGSLTLQQHWNALPAAVPGDAQAMGLLDHALRAIAQLHANGLVQADLHLGNFLLASNQIYVIDGDAVDNISPGQPLGSRQAEDNLAIFFAQLDSGWDQSVELLLIDYLNINPLSINPDRLLKQIRKERAGRLSDWLDKSLRECTAFKLRQNWWRFAVTQRSSVDALSALIEQPDKPFDSQPSFKDGGSSSVTLATAASHDLVVKRYNIKGFGHWLTRFWRPSRAWHSWLAAQRLAFLGIPTPAPLAMIEDRFGPLRRRAWLICDYCAGQHLFDLFGRQGEAEPSAQQGDALMALSRQLKGARISHGDFKATNLLWFADKIWLIDLDSMQVHSSETAWESAWSVDRARLVRNWPAESPLAQWLEAHLP